MKLAALWIVKNEAGNIRRSIESIGGMADELVVVDTGSTDDTVAVAEGLGARVAHFEWVNDFAAARNFALQQVEADIILFIDADEWFEPALDEKARRTIEGRFAQPDLHVGQFRKINIEAATGAVIDEMIDLRVLRGGGVLYYVGRIHEHLMTRAGNRLEGEEIPGLTLKHDGYSRDQVPEKLRRNTEMLETAARDEGNSEAEQARAHLYLVRENSMGGQDWKSLDSLLWLLDHPVSLRNCLKIYMQLGSTFLFMAIKLAAQYRGRVSRRQVYAATVENALKLYEGHPLHHIIGLYYNLYFDNRDGVLLAEIESAMEKAERQRDGTVVDMDDYLQTNITLYTAAGQAAWRRGNRELAFDYASRALKLTKTVVRPETVALLMNCVRGLPSQDVAAFLTSMVDTTQRSVLDSLLGCLHYEGETDLHAYFVKKLLDAGWAKKSDFWYLMIVLGKAEEAVEAALQAADGAGDEVVARTLFLAVACAGEKAPALLARCGDRLGHYAGLAAYMADGTAAEKPDFGIAVANYELIAFAAGRQTANRLLDAYEGLGRECWLLQAVYYMTSGLYRELLLEGRYMPRQDDSAVRLIRAERDLMAGDHGRALTEIKVLLANCPPNAGIFNLCAVVAENTEDAAAREEAVLIMEQVQPVYEQQVDWQDIADTDWLPEEDTKKQRKALGQMTAAQFDRTVVRRGFQPLEGLLEAAASAAEKLVEGGRYEAALPALRCPLEFGAGNDTTWELLAALFDGAGNPQTAKAMRGRIFGRR